MSWIKVRVNLWTHPKVVTLASRLSVTKPHAIGGLCALWFVTDQHADDDGRLDITAEAMDAEVQIPGFCAAMESIGWLSIGPDGLQVPRYQEHNGSTGKQRAASQKRSKASRLRNGTVTAERDASVTREEKSREEKKKDTPTVCRARPTLDEVTAYCRERGNAVDPQRWIDHYTANGWKVGKNPMKDWKAAVRTWEKNDGRVNGFAAGSGAGTPGTRTSGEARRAHKAATEYHPINGKPHGSSIRRFVPTVPPDPDQPVRERLEDGAGRSSVGVDGKRDTDAASDQGMAW